MKLLKLTRKHYHYNKIFTLLFVSLLLIAISEDIILNNWYHLFLSIISLLFIYLPYLISRKTELYIPPGFQVIFILFLYGGIYLGELKNFYFRFWWWDSMLHAFSGIILGFIAFFLLYILNKEEQIKVMMSPILLAIFSFTFAVTMGTAWEIFEFSMDSLFGFSMQRFGLVDTMWDLILDALGGLLASIIGYIYLKREEPFLFSQKITRFTLNHFTKNEHFNE